MQDGVIFLHGTARHGGLPEPLCYSVGHLASPKMFKAAMESLMMDARRVDPPAWYCEAQRFILNPCAILSGISGVSEDVEGCNGIAD